MDCSPNRRSLSRHLGCLQEHEWKDLSASQPNVKRRDVPCLFMSHKLSKKWQRHLSRYAILPKRHNDWLNSDEINIIMKQWQDTLSHFKFLGAYPADALSVFQSMGRSFKQLVSRFLHNDALGKVGLILNTDSVGAPGQHWVAIFIDRAKKSVEYYDPVGKPPHANMKSALKLLTPHHYTFVYNKYQHQKENGECGMFSIVFLLHRASGKSVSSFAALQPNDEQMTFLRSQIFGDFKMCSND